MTKCQRMIGANDQNHAFENDFFYLTSNYTFFHEAFTHLTKGRCGGQSLMLMLLLLRRPKFG